MFLALFHTLSMKLVHINFKKKELRGEEETDKDERGGEVRGKKEGEGAEVKEE